MPERTDGESVPGDTWLTQLGHLKTSQGLSWSRFNYSFRCGPSSSDQGYLSVMEGKLSVEEMVPLIARADSAGTADCVRYAPAQMFIDQGFEVLWRPLPMLPGHIGISASVPWDEEVSAKFDACFTEYLRGW